MGRAAPRPDGPAGWICRMDVKTLNTLIAIVDHRGFAAAGAAVGLSPSGVSLQIKSLEDEFRLTLFDRSTRPPRLTAQGRAFVARARAVIAGWQRLTESLAPDAIVGVLELGAVPTVVSGTLPLALARLRRHSPDLRIRLTTGLSHELEQLLGPLLICLSYTELRVDGLGHRGAVRGVPRDRLLWHDDLLRAGNSIIPRAREDDPALRILGE